MSFTPKEKAARYVIQCEMHQYDRLAEKPRIRVERAVVPDPNNEDGSRKCAHGVWLHEVCDKCGRVSFEDLRPYIVARQQRVKELLNQINKA
jgi:hypothetical protein